MSEVMKDNNAIKLFGKTISFQPHHDHNNNTNNKVEVTYDDDHITHESDDNQRQSCYSETSTSQDSSSSSSKDVSGGEFTGTKHDADSIDPTDETLQETGTTSSEISDDLSAACPQKGSQETALKKPDKIIPCPRCNSMDTKFCYYNNYNVSQPRHFCKKCQRYWTAGGTMRNVPVGSGRRKNKSTPITNYDHIMVSARDEFAINGTQLSSVKPNGFLMFGSEPVQSSLNPAERSQTCVQTSSRDSFASGLSQPAFPVTFYPSMPYWGCAIPNSWNGPWASLSQSPNLAPTTSPLGKHCREGNMLRPPVLIPKTLRIHDPSDAAKSSIWSTLGIKNGKVGSTNGTSLFKAFESKGDRNVRNIDNCQLVLHANPAALSRSLNFHESS